MYVGESERKIREKFAIARSAAPCILFFDEIDALAKGRSADSHSAINLVQTLLVELDGMQSGKGVFVLAATNNPELLDPALLRPGRLNPHHYVGPPDQKAREAIFEIQFRDVSLTVEADYSKLASETECYSGAEIVKICSRAKNLVQDERDDTPGADLKDLKITTEHFKQAIAETSPRIKESDIRRYTEWGRSSGAE